MKLKTQLIISNVLLGVVVLLLVGTTIAYFSDFKQISNTMTAGSVEIALSEAAVKEDERGNLVEDAQKPRIMGQAEDTPHDYGVIYPGQTIFKDPTILNVGENDAWIAAKVTFEDGAGDLHKLLGYPDDPRIDIELMLQGGLLDERVRVGEWNGFQNVCYNDRYAMVQVPDPLHDRYVFYFFFNEMFEHGESAMLFDTMYVDEFFNGSLLQELKDLKITIRAYASQSFGFETCYDAMTNAFPEHFDF